MVAPAKKLNREAFLRQLQAVRPGLTPRESTEQSNCLVFSNGEVCTFDGEELACRNKSSLEKSFSGAVRAEKFITQLEKWSEEEIEFSADDGKALLRGKRRGAWFHLEAEVTLPIDAVEKPEEWFKLHNDFSEAIEVVHHCASTKEDSEFYKTCVHVHPKWVEACDNTQLCRWKMKTGVKEPTLVRHTSIKHIANLGMTEFAETQNWLHFRNASGLQLSCRRYVEDFPDFGKFLDMTGTPTALPKGLVEALDKAYDFSKNNVEDDHVRIIIKPGKLRLEAEGIDGGYWEAKSIKYSGKRLDFYIAPQLLSDLVKKHSECELTEDKLKISTGSYTYVAVLYRRDEKEAARESKEEEETGEASESGEE